MKEQAKVLFTEKTNHVFIQLFRYTFVGGFAFVIDFGLLWFLKEIFGLHYLLSATLAFIAGLTVNYFISIRWVFIRYKNRNRISEFFYFTFIGIIGLGLNDLFMWLFTDKVQFHYLISKIAAAILVYLWNFFARKYLLFNTKNIHNE